MRRREFIAGLGGAAAWPLAARAQQPATPIIGYLYSGSSEENADLVAAFRKGLGDAGYVDGRNVAIEYRWANNESNRLAELAGDLVRRRVAVIVATGNLSTALAAKAATATTPIVFVIGADPVRAGLVTSLNRPDANITGVTAMNVDLVGKRLGLLREIVPGAVRVAALVNPDNAAADSIITDMRAASALGLQIEVLTAATNRDIDAAFASLAQVQAAGLLVSADTLFYSRRVQLVTLAVKYSVPVIFPYREDARAGGLMSYGPNARSALFAQGGIYTARILKGEKPNDLPIMRVSTFELVINLQTARALGLTIPETLLATADEVIQ